MKKKQYSVYIYPSLMKEIQILAIDRDSTASALITEAVKEWLKKIKKKQKNS